MTSQKPKVAVLIPLLAVSFALMLAGCSMNVQDEKGEKNKSVEITTPVGELKVRSDKFDMAQVGLALYPGAREVHGDEDSPDRATVSIATALFGLKVVAASFESDDEPQKVLDFYRKELARHGKVSECRGGDIDFRDDSDEVICKPERGKSDEIALVTGVKHKFRVVGVHPKGKGSKFGVALVQLRGEKETM